MKPEDLSQAIIEDLIAVAPDLDAESVSEDAHFLDDLGIDSMDYLNLISALQRRFSVSIAEVDYPRLTTVAALSQYLDDKIS